MRNERPRKRRRFRIHPIIKFLFSIAALCLILYLAGFAFRFCLGLFIANEDYLVQIPGQGSPIAVVQPEQDPSDLPTNQIVETGRATILAAGDIMSHMPIVRSAETGSGYDFSSMFQYVIPYTDKADYAVANLETTLSGTDGGREYTGYPDFNAPDALATGAYLGGFDMLLTANNRCYDYGTAGLLRTLETVRSAGMDSLGVSANAEENRYLVKDLNGIKIGMINYTFAEINDDRNRPTIDGEETDKNAAGLINVFDYDSTDMFYAEMENHLSGMQAAGAEAVVVYLHWGDEFHTEPGNSQKAIARKLCDMGVDVIVGSHPHTVQPAELLTSSDGTHQTLCLYSAGNFLSNQRHDNIALTTGHSEDGVMLGFTFVRYSNGQVFLESAELIPTWVLVRGSGDNRAFRILPLDDQIADWAGAYDLDKNQLAEAKASAERTNAIVGSGMAAIRSALEQANIQRNQALGIFTGGVG